MLVPVGSSLAVKESDIERRVDLLVDASWQSLTVQLGPAKAKRTLQHRQVTLGTPVRQCALEG